LFSIRYQPFSLDNPDFAIFTPTLNNTAFMARVQLYLQTFKKYD